MPAVAGFVGAENAGASGFLVASRDNGTLHSRSMDDFVALEHSLGTDATNIDTPPPSLLVEQRLKPSRLVARLAQYLDKLQQHLGSAMHPAYAQFIGGDRDQEPGPLQGLSEEQARRIEMEQAQKKVEVEMPKHDLQGNNQR